MDFYQAPPELKNVYENDPVLKGFLKQVLSPADFAVVDKDLQRFGDRVISECEPLAQIAEKHPPFHIPYDAWGNRIDHIETSEAWNKLHQIAAEEGIVALGFERPLNEFSRVWQFAKLYLYHPSSAIYSCPLAMTDGAARVLEVHGSEDQKNRAYKFLTTRNPEKFWTSGQWMTERSGGSDVSGTSTIANNDGDFYRLSGVKWFTSATTSQMAMTLARIEGDEKLSLFYVELRDKNNKLQNIKINRLKEKLGTKALPTAELTLEGTPAVLVGERGKGVKTIATLFNITRVYNACCAVGYMKRGLDLAIDYAHKREVFGKKLIDHDLHVETLSRLKVQFEASFLMTFKAALYLGKDETKKASEVESGTLRMLIPLAKLYTAKIGVGLSSEVLESFGGAGYVEDTGLPQLLRNAQVLSIWEGTTNVLSLDVIRAVKKEASLPFFNEDVRHRLNKAPEELKISAAKLENMLQEINQFLENEKSENVLSGNARVIAISLSDIYCGSLLIENAGLEKSERSFIVASRFIEMILPFKKNSSDYFKDSRKIL